MADFVYPPEDVIAMVIKDIRERFGLIITAKEIDFPLQRNPKRVSISINCDGAEIAHQAASDVLAGGAATAPAPADTPVENKPADAPDASNDSSLETKPADTGLGGAAETVVPTDTPVGDDAANADVTAIDAKGNPIAADADVDTDADAPTTSDLTDTSDTSLQEKPAPVTPKAGGIF